MDFPLTHARITSACSVHTVFCCVGHDTVRRRTGCGGHLSIWSLSYHSSQLTALTSRPTLTHANEPSAIHKVGKSLDPVRGQVLNERKQVNAFDIECLPIRKFDMRKELFRKKNLFGRASHKKGAEESLTTHMNPGLSRGL